MNYQITISRQAQKDLQYFSKHNQQLFAKIENLIFDLDQNPFSGVGKPEPLKFELSGYWAKRINKEHRLIYKVNKNLITIKSCRFHY